jgi:hypothetical protein
MQVKDELDNIARRLHRMNSVHNLGQSNPLLAPVYHALAETSDPTRAPPRELLRCNSDRTAQVLSALLFRDLNCRYRMPTPEPIRSVRSFAARCSVCRTAPSRNSTPALFCHAIVTVTKRNTTPMNHSRTQVLLSSSMQPHAAVNKDPYFSLTVRFTWEVL